VKVVILMTSGPKTPWRCASPFYIAALMASNDAEVEMFFNMDGTRLLKKGVAERILPAELKLSERQRKEVENCL
jgi:predicted peroxiredoxin